MINKFNIVKEIVLNPFIVLVIYNTDDVNTNDAVIVKNKPQSQSLDEFNNRAIETISSVFMRRKSENRTEIMTFEFDNDFYIAVTDWCNSLKITLEQLAFAFVEFICIKENRDVVIPWMKELQNEQH
ncbi:MAG: hypothetical protein J6A69_07870 [Clostridia bacterium]|nr:hypothetical protein [Clostridia bacterium]